MIHLLDVNVLVALFDPDHVHHELAHDWLADHRREGWATSPTTEAGFLRVLGNPAYPGSQLRCDALAEKLRAFCASGEHTFWHDEVTLRDTTRFRLAFAKGHRQLTDVYLLGLATHMGGRLATFDRAIPLGAVVGARTETLAVIAPVDEPSPTE